MSRHTNSQNSNTKPAEHRRKRPLFFRGFSVFLSSVSITIALVFLLGDNLASDGFAIAKPGIEKNSSVNSIFESSSSASDVSSEEISSSSSEEPEEESKEESEIPSSQPDKDVASSSEEQEEPSSSPAPSSKEEKPAPDANVAYLELRIEKPTYTAHVPGDKVAYLTFDDGPSDYTITLLDILDAYEIKATFFDVGIRSKTAEIAMKETVKRGHTLAVHTYTHDFHTIYRSVDAFLQDFKKERDYIYSVTGVEPTIFRFAGGSFNSFNKRTAMDIIQEMESRGYTYYDWNVDSGDATGNNIPSKTIYNNVIQGVYGHDKAIILMHNTNMKKTTLDALPKIIEELKRQGYRFDVLDNTVEPIQFPRKIR